MIDFFYEKIFILFFLFKKILMVHNKLVKKTKGGNKYESKRTTVC